jgi:GntR family transcriptional regulator
LGWLVSLGDQMPVDTMWRRIAEDLREKIESGALGKDGEPLPTELELRDQYKASRNTVRDAIKWLAGRGLIVTKPGQGTFVVTKINPFVVRFAAESGGENAAYISEAKARSRTASVSDPKIEIRQANGGKIALELQLEDGATVLSRHQERFIDDTPWSLQTTFYPMSLVDNGATRLLQVKDIQAGAVVYIEETLGIKQAGWRDRIEVRAPDRNETDFFSLPDDGRIAVVEIIQTGYDQVGRPLRVTVTTYPADRNQFLVETGAVPEDFSPQEQIEAKPSSSIE